MELSRPSPNLDGRPADGSTAAVHPPLDPTPSFSSSASSSSHPMSADQTRYPTNPSPTFSHSDPSPFGSSPSLPFSSQPRTDSPPIHPPSAAYLSHAVMSEPMGYTPLNDPSVGSSTSKFKGKGRAKNQGWVDLERGGGGELTGQEAEKLEMVNEGWERLDESTPGPSTAGLSEYPPPLAMSEEEKEEKRIAENLARMHEKDLARRRAARESKYLKSHAGRAGSGSSAGSRKRWSLFGGVDPGSQSQTGHLPLSYTGSPPPQASPVLSPVSTSFASSSSHSSQPGAREPMSPTLPTASYQGREWTGGAQVQRRRERRQLGFFESLCGTGRDRRPGEDEESEEEDNNQGRTNPFE